MPPRARYTREEIIKEAYEMTRESGIDSVAARTLGKRLGTSSSPIFTVCKNMDEVKDAVRELVKQTFLKRIEGMFDYDLPFKEFGMRWVRFSVEEPHLYSLLFLTTHEKEIPYQTLMREFHPIFERMMEEVEWEFNIGEEDAKALFNHMIIHANGLASLYINRIAEYDETEVCRSLSSVCVGIVIEMWLRNGTYQERKAMAMAKSAESGIVPKKRGK